MVPDKNTVRIALSKGRILKETLPLLQKMGIHPEENLNHSRKLICNTSQTAVQLIIVRATDAPIYVREGAADIGIVGKDVLMELGDYRHIGEYTDLKIAPCSLCLASVNGKQLDPHQRVRVASKYVNIAQQWLSERGQPFELVKLYGSMELAPLVNLADYIVDLVDTGNTLKANGLMPIEHITSISTRLIYNIHSRRTKHHILSPLMKQFEEAVND